MKLSLNELQIGQQLITVVNKNVNYYDDNFALCIDWDKFLEKDVLLTVIDKKKNGTIVVCVNDTTDIFDRHFVKTHTLMKGSKFNIGITNLRFCTKEYGEILTHPDIIQYKIFKGDKPIKMKYFADMGKVKSSILMMFPYFDNDWDSYRKYKDDNPEIEHRNDYIGYTDIKVNEEDTKEMYVVRYINKNKKNPIKVDDFNVHEYYKQSMLLKGITYKFGEAARKLFKEYLENREFKYIIVHMNDKYLKLKNSGETDFWEYKQIEDDDLIKNLLKQNKIKEFKRCYKCGKTAIALKNDEDLEKLLFQLRQDTYYFLDCDGDELILKGNRYIKLRLLGFGD
jgi:hypothetical protein